MKLLQPYLLGCLIGDGGLHGNMTFANLDLDILERVNQELSVYGYYLKKRSANPKRSSEYTISPKQDNRIKYKYIYKNIEYLSATKLMEVLQADGYPVTNHDTLLSIVGKSPKTKKCYLLKYFPDLKEKLFCEQLKETQSSQLIDSLNDLHLRCRFDEKRIPAQYLTLSFEDRLNLFQGLMDTDGSISSNKRLEFCVANQLLAADFAALAESLGYTYKVYEKQSKYFNKKYNEVRYGHKAYRILLNYNEKIQPFYCKRKLELYNKNIGVVK